MKFAAQQTRARTLSENARAPSFASVAHALAVAIGPHHPCVFLARDEATDEISIISESNAESNKDAPFGIISAAGNTAGGPMGASRTTQTNL